MLSEWRRSHSERAPVRTQQPEGNYGEDVKDFHLAGTPTAVIQSALQISAATPYEQLREENRRRDRSQPEYELVDTGILMKTVILMLKLSTPKPGLKTS